MLSQEYLDHMAAEKPGDLTHQVHRRYLERLDLLDFEMNCLMAWWQQLCEYL